MSLKIFLLMILLHIFDDFHLQGILKHMKQKAWWKKQEWYDEMYENDYQTALHTHSMQWAIMTSLPLWFVPAVSTQTLGLIVLLNAIIHYYVDDLKCNKMKINLSTDQLIHVVQITLTWFICGFL